MPIEKWSEKVWVLHLADDPQFTDDIEALDQMSAVALRDGAHFSLRWVLLHLIEETARHAGHADILRESIDGLVGD